MKYTVAALYRFVAVPEPLALRDELRNAFTADELCGSLLIAVEGINGTLAGSADVLNKLLDLLHERTGLTRAEVKFSHAGERPFGRLKFILRDEIIPFRRAVVDATKAGTYVEAGDWNALIADPEVLLIDTRNHYEVEAGTFVNAMDPGIETFSEFATWVRGNLDPTKTLKVAMFCTGGIRCEKASAFMLQEGFQDVFHLRGGILKYLEDVPSEESRWKGECFVFDRRRGVGHDHFELGAVERERSHSPSVRHTLEGDSSRGQS